jgi:hypothetical protein
MYVCIKQLADVTFPLLAWTKRSYSRVYVSFTIIKAGISTSAVPAVRRTDQPPLCQPELTHHYRFVHSTVENAVSTIAALFYTPISWYVLVG